MKHVKYSNRVVMSIIACGYIILILADIFLHINIMYLLAPYVALTLGVISYTKKRSIKFTQYYLSFELDLNNTGHILRFYILALNENAKLSSSSNQVSNQAKTIEIVKSSQYQTVNILDLDKFRQFLIDLGYIVIIPNFVAQFNQLLVSYAQNSDVDNNPISGISTFYYDDILPEYKKFKLAILSNMIQNNNGAGICAINTTFKYNNTLNIPVIYILFIVVEEKHIAGNIIKELKIYNYIEIARLLSQVLNKNMLIPVVKLAKTFQHNVKEKSIFFAFESLKYFATFISNETAARTNQQQLADVIFPFHNGKAKTIEINQRFIHEFLRAEGYIEYDKNRQTKELSLELLEHLITQKFIPFNRLDKNRIICL